MTPKTIVITGATAGIGLAATMRLAELGNNLILVSRDEKRLQQVKRNIAGKYNTVACDVYPADLSSMSGIRGVAARIIKNHATINVLLNNAGGVFPEYRETVDGFEYTFAFNHLSYFLLTGLLLPLLGKSEEPRIINTSSKAHNGSRLDFSDIMHKQHFKPMEVYGESKLANLYFTYKLASLLNETNITVNALHPGVVQTNFGKDMPGIWKLILPIIRKFFISAQEGAETPVFLATSPEVTGVNGAYFIKKKPVVSSLVSLEEARMNKLWNLSEELTGFSYTEVIAALPKAAIPAGED